MATTTIEARSNNTIVQIADAVVKCYVDKGLVNVCLGKCGGDSISGVLLEKIGDKFPIGVSCDGENGVRIYDGDKYVDITIINGKKRRNVAFKYSTSTNTWFRVPDR